MPLGLGQLHVGLACVPLLHETVKAGVGRTGRDQRLPRADSLLDRLKGAGQDDRAGDHPAWRQFIAQHQVSPSTEHRYLDHQAQHLRGCHDQAGAIAGGALQSKRRVVVFMPATRDTRHQSHRLDDLGISDSGIGLAHRLHPLLAAGLEKPARRDLVRDREQEQDDGARQRYRSQRRMQEIDDQQIDRHPGRIEQRKDPGACDELPHLRDIA